MNQEWPPKGTETLTYRQAEHLFNYQFILHLLNLASTGYIPCFNWFVTAAFKKGKLGIGCIRLHSGVAANTKFFAIAEPENLIRQAFIIAVNICRAGADLSPY